MLSQKQVKKTGLSSRGDTIVEVLIAIAIAAFAIGISYATAQRSLQKSITAREHNEALNEAENQIADLNLRFQNATDFGNQFANQNHFCLNDLSKGPADTNQWTIYQNQAVDLSSPLADASPSTASNPYDTGCTHQRSGDGAKYFVDIIRTGGTGTDAVYTVNIRWEQLNGNQHNQVGLSYKLNGSAKTLALNTTSNPGGSILPPGTTTLTTNLAVMQWKGYNDPPNLVGYANGVSFLNCTFKPLGVGDNCPGYRGTYNCQNTVPGTNFADPSINAGKWDSNETCSLYSATWVIPVAETSLKTVDFEFTNDHWDFSKPTGGRDNNIIVWDTDIPSPPILYFGNYCQVVASPPIPQSGTRITDTNVLPLFWNNYFAHMYVDSNPPDGGQCT